MQPHGHAPLEFDESVATRAVRAASVMADVAGILGGYRFRFITEKDLQDGIERALVQRQVLCRREVNLDKLDRPDFMIDGGVLIEVKIKGSLAQALRQIARYAAHDEINGIIVAGTPHWLSRVPDSIGGKPVRAVRLIGSLL